MARKLFLLPILLFIFIEVSAQSTLSVDYIMRDPKWMGTFPSAPSWGEDSNQIFFKYNQENDPADSLYKIELGKPSNIAKVHWPEEKGLAKPLLAYNSDQSLRIYRKDNAIIFEDQKKKTTTTLLTWHEPVSNLRFLATKIESPLIPPEIFTFMTDPLKVFLNRPIFPMPPNRQAQVNLLLLTPDFWKLKILIF